MALKWLFRKKHSKGCKCPTCLPVMPKKKKVVKKKAKKKAVKKKK